MARTLDDILRTPYTFIAIADHDDGGWVITYPDLPGCITQADTYDEAARMARDAFESWVTYRFDEGLPIPEPAFAADPSWDWDSVRPHDEVPTFTTREVARELEVSVGRVHQLARSRHVGQRRGRALVYSRKDLEKLRGRKPGRPPKKNERTSTAA
jgi:predicted RNase H-like HicB family nuclease